MGTERIVVAMSGGVDSAVAAGLLHEAGHDVVGVTLRTWAVDDCTRHDTKGCCSGFDVEDARMVADAMGFAHYVVDVAEQFRSSVIEYFLDSYRVGETPNPCIACNERIKLGDLWKQAEALGASAVATGHHARVDWHAQQRLWRLRRGADRAKDQSYALFSLTQKQLAVLRTPVGELTKHEVRAWAADHDLPVADKPDSQEICFVGDGNTRAYLQHHLAGELRTGNIVDESGQVLGTHEGTPLFTVGQRRGLGLAADEPLYVLEIRAESNELVVGPRRQLGTQCCWLRNVMWVAGPPDQGRVETTLQLGAHHVPVPVSIERVAEAVWKATFLEPELAVTPGQAGVLYRQDEVIGGGWIERTAPSRVREMALQTVNDRQERGAYG